jgi:SAM-dependent methyltransferase
MAFEDPIAYWNGPAAERWTREQEAIDRAFQSLTAKLFAAAAIRSGERVLDVGCGCGSTTLTAAEKVGPSGVVTGVDVSGPMLGRARERAVGAANVSFHLADATTFAFQPSHDLVTSRFGVMFFPEPERAFANLRSALGPEGRLVFMCWRPMAENTWARVPYEAAAPYLPPEPPSKPDAPGPFSFADPARVEHILDRAGFRQIHLEPFDGEVLLSDDGVDSAVAFATHTGPTARALRDASDEAKAKVRAALASVLAAATRDGRTVLGGAVWIASARR